MRRLSIYGMQAQVLEATNALKLADERAASETAAAGTPVPLTSAAPSAPVKIITPIGQLVPCSVHDEAAVGN